MKRYSNNTSLYAEVTPEEYKLVQQECLDNEITLKKWLHEAIIEKIERDNERI